MKIPTPRKLSSGSWYIYMRLGGNGVSVSDRNKADCIAKARSIKAQYKAGELELKKDVPPKDRQLGEIIDAYIDAHSAVLSPSTVRGYRIQRRNQFRDYMDLPVSEIDFQRMVNDETACVGPKTIKNAFALVSASLKYAALKVPAVKLPAVPVKEIPFLQPEEIAPFLDEIEDDPAELAVLFMLHGLRVSEVLALTWEKSIDLRRRRIVVHGAVVRDEDNLYTRKDTNKNVTSARSVPIMIPRLLELLQASKVKKGPLCSMLPHSMLPHIKSACERAGVTVVGNHGLRHSFASLCRFLGIPEEQTMAWGGWADYQTMHKRYIRIARSAAERDREKMASFFGNSQTKTQTKTANA